MQFAPVPSVVQASGLAQVSTHYSSLQITQKLYIGLRLKKKKRKILWRYMGFLAQGGAFIYKCIQAINNNTV